MFVKIPVHCYTFSWYLFAMLANTFPGLKFNTDDRRVYYAFGSLTDDELAAVEEWEGVAYINPE